MSRYYRGISGYFKNLLLAISSLLTAVFCGAHHLLPFSAQAGKWLSENKLRGKIFVPIINNIFFFDKDHCQRSWEFQRELLAYELDLRQKHNFKQ